MQAELLERGILVGTSGDPHVVRLLPPLILEAPSTSTRWSRRSRRSARMKRFLDLADSPPAESTDLLALAAPPRDATREPPALAGKVLGLLFFNPSLRTLASFQAGMVRLGGSVAS